MHTVPDSVLRFTGAAAAAVGLIAAQGCVQRTKTVSPVAATTSVPQEEPLPKSLLRLSAKAKAEADRPRSLADLGPLPPGISPALATRLQPVTGFDPQRITMSRNAAVTDLASTLPAPIPRPSEISPTDAQTAVSLYITGREKLLAANPAGAISDLKKATELDPSAGEPWRELGEAQLATGLRIEAVASFERATACGLEDPRVLELLGRHALERSDPEHAGALLARASLAAPERSDPLLPPVIDLSLSRAMAQAGYTTAARDVLLVILTRPPQLSASTRYGEEYGAIQRRQGDLWREVGDLSCRLSEFDRAIDAYARAQALPVMDDEAIGPRLVYACLRAGRPHAAALAVVRRIAAEQGRVSVGDAELLRYLSEHTATGPEIASALQVLTTDLPKPLKPTIERGLASARAAVAGAEGAAILREYAASHTVDPDLARTIVELAPTAAAAVRESVVIVEKQPRSALRFSEALLQSRFDIEQIDAALSSERATDAGNIIRAYFLVQRGFASQAAEEARKLTVTSALAPAADLARVEVGIAAGEIDLAEQGITGLRAQATPARAFYLARSLSWFQRNREALTELEPLLSPDSRDMDAILLASELAVSLERGDDAERWLKQAHELDPLDDRPYSRMLVIYGAGGLKADSAKLNQTVRDLRDTAPESRTLRAARTKELARRSLLSQAETEARRLADEGPSDAGAVDLFITIVRARAERDGTAHLTEGRQWLESRLIRRPGSPSLLAALCTIMVAEGESSQAERLLQQSIEAGGAPDLSRMREKILRDELSRPDEATATALGRLQGRDRTISESIEFAEVQARAVDDVSAAQTILDAATGEITLLPEQETRMLVLTGQMSQRAIDKPDDDRRRAAARLFDFLIARGVKFSPEMHQRRLVVLALWPEADADRLLAAANFTAKEFPNLGSAPFVRTSQALVAAKRGVVANVFIAKAIRESADPGLDLFTEWFRLTVMFGTPSHAKELIAKAESAGKLRELAQRASGQTEAELAGRDPRAETAYLLGNYYAADNRDDQASAAYELALEYDPAHPWACNNLGYSMLERGGDLERAGTLLERAHATLPKEAAITDSLGWLRYKQGQLFDERGEDGAVGRRGAVSLLQDAADTDRGQRDPTILDHLGDALWLAGRADDAQRYWDLTERVATRLLASPPNAAATEGDNKEAESPPAAVEELRTLRGAAAAKSRAAKQGDTVQVAPQIGIADPQPPKTEPKAEATPSPATEERPREKEDESETPTPKRID